MEEQKNNLDNLMEHVKAYMETRSKLMILTLSEKAVKLFSSLGIHIALTLFLLLLLLFGSVSLACWIGEQTGSMSCGFGSVTAIYFVLTLIVFLLRKNKKVKGLLEDVFVKILFQNENE